MLAAGGKKIVFYETAMYEPLFEYGSYSEPVRGLHWCPDSKYLLIVPTTHYPEIIRPLVNGSKRLQHLKVKDVSAAAFYNKSWRYIGAGCGNGEVFVWDTKKQVIDKKLCVTYSSVNCISLSNTDNYICAGCENGSIVLYGIKTNQKFKSFNIMKSKRPITSLRFSLKEQGLFGATNDEGYVAVWDFMKRNSCLFALKKHSAICSDIAFSPVNTHFFASVGYDGKICMCDLRSGQSVCTRETNYALTSVHLTLDGTMMACGHRNGGLLIYDLRCNKEPLLERSGDDGMVSRVAYTGDMSSISTTQGSGDTSLDKNVSMDSPKANRNESVSSDQLNNSFLRLYDSPSVSKFPSIDLTEVNDDKQDSFLDDLDSPSSVVRVKFQHNEPVQINDTMYLMSQSTESGDKNHLMLVPVNKCHQSTPEKGDEDNVSVPEVKEDKEDVPEVDPSQVVTKADLELLKKELEETWKRHKAELGRQIRCDSLQLRSFMCKQNILVMNKLETLEMAQNDQASYTSFDEYDSEKLIQSLYAQNAALTYEVSRMRAEREKYLPIPPKEDE